MNQVILDSLKQLKESVPKMIIADYSLDLEDDVNRFSVFEKIAFQNGEIKVAFSLDHSLLILELSSALRLESKMFLLPENEILVSFGGIIGLYILHYIDLVFDFYVNDNSDFIESEKIRFLNWEKEVSEKIRLVNLENLF